MPQKGLLGAALLPPAQGGQKEAFWGSLGPRKGFFRRPGYLGLWGAEGGPLGPPGARVGGLGQEKAAVLVVVVGYADERRAVVGAERRNEPSPASTGPGQGGADRL